MIGFRALLESQSDSVLARTHTPETCIRGPRTAQWTACDLDLDAGLMHDASETIQPELYANAAETIDTYAAVFQF